MKKTQQILILSNWRPGILVFTPQRMKWWRATDPETTLPPLTPVKGKKTE